MHKDKTSALNHAYQAYGSNEFVTEFDQMAPYYPIEVNRYFRAWQHDVPVGLFFTFLLR